MERMEQSPSWEADRFSASQETGKFMEAFTGAR